MARITRQTGLSATAAHSAIEPGGLGRKAGSVGQTVVEPDPVLFAWSQQLSAWLLTWRITSLRD
jgi:hypothetical protein